jgi:hypothetical protein
MTQRGDFLNSDEPGKTAKRALRAPMYSRFSVSYMPMCESSPLSTAWWTRVGSAVALFGVASFGVIPSSLTACRSCEYRSCHSRTRR